jgi:NAD(P)-dependent dehydrogenase (short-subunit alcohol dehydrogenase family)
MNALGNCVCAVVGDVRDEAFSKRLVDTALSHFGGLDGAFNNAGILGKTAPLPEIGLEEWRDVIESNLTGAYLSAKHQLPAISEHGEGAIVFTSSFVGQGIGLPGMAAYAASKAGLIGLTQALAAEWGPMNIRVNALLPGGTVTEMAGADPDSHAAIAAMHALKRMASADEIAKAALFLLSSDASFVTGSSFYADGGNSICKG